MRNEWNYDIIIVNLKGWKMLGKYREMFCTATSFLESGEFCFNSKDGFVRGFDTVVIVNYAFACEVYLKLLLLHQGLTDVKKHNLFELYQQLPEKRQRMIMVKIFNKGIWLTDAFGRSELENVSDCFVKWRYRYEFSTLSCNISFLNELARTLRDECCETVFNSTWDNLKGII